MTDRDGVVLLRGKKKEDSKLRFLLQAIEAVGVKPYFVELIENW